MFNGRLIPAQLQLDVKVVVTRSQRSSDEQHKIEELNKAILHSSTTLTSTANADNIHSQKVTNVSFNARHIHKNVSLAQSGNVSSIGERRKAMSSEYSGWGRTSHLNVSK